MYASGSALKSWSLSAAARQRSQLASDSVASAAFQGQESLPFDAACREEEGQGAAASDWAAHALCFATERICDGCLQRGWQGADLGWLTRKKESTGLP